MEVFYAKDKIGWVDGDVFGYTAKCPVVIDVKLTTKEEHDNKLRLSIIGMILTPNGKCWIAGGQIFDTLRKLLKEGKLKPNTRRNWTINDIEQLIDIWEKWMLHDIKPVPESLKEEYWKAVKEYEEKHQQEDYLEFMESRFGKEFGNKWYFWELPEEVVDWLVSKFKGGAVYVNRL